MANTEGYTVSNTEDLTGDILNTTVRGAVIDLANNITGLLNGSNIATGTIAASEFNPTWVTASTPQTTVNGGFYRITAGDTVTLHTSPSDMDRVTLTQDSGDFTSSAGTVNGNGKNIDYNLVNSVAASATMTIDANFIGNIVLTYSSGQGVWKIT